MIPEIRSGVLSADVGYSEDDEEEETEEKGIKEVRAPKPKFSIFPKIFFHIIIKYIFFSLIHNTK